jgi:hypothetical protein
MATITLTEQDIMRLKVIMMDQDKDDAYVFLRDQVMPEIQQQEGKAMKSHLDGGKGSMF